MPVQAAAKEGRAHKKAARLSAAAEVTAKSLETALPQRPRIPLVFENGLETVSGEHDVERVLE